jgi:hypothetical protein
MPVRIVGAFLDNDHLSWIWRSPRSTTTFSGDEKRRSSTTKENAACRHIPGTWYQADRGTAGENPNYK